MSQAEKISADIPDAASGVPRYLFTRYFDDVRPALWHQMGYLQGSGDGPEGRVWILGDADAAAVVRLGRIRIHVEPQTPDVDRQEQQQGGDECCKSMPH